MKAGMRKQSDLQANTSTHGMNPGRVRASGLSAEDKMGKEKLKNRNKSTEDTVLIFPHMPVHTYAFIHSCVLSCLSTCEGTRAHICRALRLLLGVFISLHSIY